MAITAELKEQWVGRELSSKRYVIEDVLGLGGMGCTFLARDRNVCQRQVVIKLIRAEHAANQVIQKRFSREMRALTKLQHPRIVQILDIGDVDRSPFIVMPYLSGGDLQKRIATLKPGNDALRKAIEWLTPIAGALDFVHDSQMVHRDVKPQNIFFDALVNSYLGDFGITKSLETDKTDGEHLTDGSWIGTIHYMSPEQLNGKVCKATDQYALGIIVYEMVTGDYPFGSKVTPQHMVNIGMLLRDILGKDVRQIEADIPNKAKDAVYRALAKEPSQRFASCAAFVSAMSDGPTTGRPDLASRTCPRCEAQFFFEPGSSDVVTCMVCNHRIEAMSDDKKTTSDMSPRGRTTS